MQELLMRGYETHLSVGAESGTTSGGGVVYAVIPVFNRMHLTRQCIRQLLAQTYRPLNIVVADGGSTDGSPVEIRREFPGVTVLTSRRVLWWAGAMATGIDHVLRVASESGDFILMMNNDTEFDLDYVAVLVRVSQQRHAAVGALTVDVRDHTKILDAGEFIDWERYDFPVKTKIEPGEIFFDGVDVLPGRGSLVPIEMIRTAGNIDWKRFPHYIADYEFFARLKRRGYRLGVTYETAIRSDTSKTGLAARAGEKRSIWHSLLLQLSRRSMNNFLDHYRFIGAAAPRHRVRAIRQRYILGLIGRALRRMGFTPLLPVAYWSAKITSWLIAPPYTLSAAEVEAHGLTASSLTKTGLLAPFSLQHDWRNGAADGYFFCASKSRVSVAGEAVAQLYEIARVGGRRLPRAAVLRFIAHRLRYTLVPLYWVSDSDCEKLGVKPSELVASAIARECGVPGFYVLSSLKWKVRQQGSQAVALYEFAHRNGQTLRKLRRRYREAH